MLAALSVDLDETRFYARIHGLPVPTRGAAARVVHEVGVPRALSFASRVGVPLTFFAVADDACEGAGRETLGAVLAAEHAIESHSSTHPYDLASLRDAALASEIAGSFDRLERAFGVRPRGFRSPGYAISDRVLEAVGRAGAIFDSSALPSPPYYLAKLAMSAQLWGRGRRSGSVVGPLSPLFGKRVPHVTRAGSVLELPIQVTRFARLPVIGTSLGLSRSIARALVRASEPTPLLNLELHGLDFVDASDAPGTLLGELPELRRPLHDRLAAIEAAVGEATARGRSFVTLRVAAELLGPTSPRT